MPISAPPQYSAAILKKTQRQSPPALRSSTSASTGGAGAEHNRPHPRTRGVRASSPSRPSCYPRACGPRGTSSRGSCPHGRVLHDVLAAVAKTEAGSAPFTSRKRRHHRRGERNTFARPGRTDFRRARPSRPPLAEVLGGRKGSGYADDAGAARERLPCLDPPARWS
jgi:hypothetical protein